MDSLAQSQTQGSDLPLSVKYARLPKKAIAGSSSLRRYASSNGTAFDPTNNNVIRIPVTASGVNTFLDGHNSYLQLRVSADNKTSNEAQQVDGGIFSFIQRLRIISRGNGAIIEDINNYNLLHNLLFKYQTDPAKLPVHNATSGTASDMIGSGNDPSAVGYSTAYNSLTGKEFSANTTAADMTLTMPIVSGFLSNTKGLAIPLGASAGFEIELTLAQPADCLVAATDVNFNVKSCHYFAPVFQITGADFQSSMVQMVQAMGGISFTGGTWENFISSTDDSAGEKVVNIPVSARSLKSLLTVSRTTTTVSAIASAGLNSCLPNVTTAYNYRIGDNMYPPSRVQVTISAVDPSNTSNAYAQVLMSLGQLNSVHAQSLINSNQFNSTAWAYAADVEKYLNSSGDLSSSGLDTLSGNLQCSLELSNNPGAAQRIDTFCLKEIMYHLSPDGSFSSSR